MRHRKKINHLSRKSAHRKAMLSNMAASLILHKRINTTLAKAKALRIYVEPLITKSKDDTTHSRRTVFSYLQNKEAVSELFRDISVKVADRPGGYTRIIKTGKRLGDNAEMCMMELVDYNENLLKETSAKAKASRRGRRKKGDETTPTATAEKTSTTEVKETPVAAIEEAEVVEEVAMEAAPEIETVIEEPIAEAKTEERVDDKTEDEPEDEAKEQNA